MKLELKHIAPYFPYELQLLEEFELNTPDIVTLRGVEIDMLITTLKRFPYNQRLSFYEAKLILRPLSDLTKEITIDRETFIPLVELYDKHNLRIAGLSKYGIGRYIINNPEYVDYFAINILLSWHFDIFNLIKNNLAVDINKM